MNDVDLPVVQGQAEEWTFYPKKRSWLRSEVQHGRPP